MRRWHEFLFRVESVLRRNLLDRPRTLRYRARGMTVGRGTLLPRIRATWPHRVRLGPRCVLDPGVAFHLPGPWREELAIDIGEHVYLGAGCEFNITTHLRIGRESMLAAGCYIVDHDHGTERRDTPICEQNDGPSGPVEIGEDVWLGARVIVLKGVTIGPGAVVGAASVVNRSIPAGEIWAGCPARRIGVRP